MGFWRHTKPDIVPSFIWAGSILSLHILMVQVTQASWNSLLFAFSKEVNSLTSHVFALRQHCSTAALTMMDVTSYTAASRRKTFPSSLHHPIKRHWPKPKSSKKEEKTTKKRFVLHTTILTITSSHVHPLSFFCWDLFCSGQASCLLVHLYSRSHRDSIFHSGTKKKGKRSVGNMCHKHPKPGTWR